MEFLVVNEVPGRLRVRLAGPVPAADVDALATATRACKGVPVSYTPLAVYKRQGQGPLDGSYRLAVRLMMAGFLFVPVLADFGVPGEAIVLAGYLGLSAVLVSLFLVMGRITGQDAALSFARGFTALFAGEMAGIALGNLLDLVGTRGQTPYAVVALSLLHI